MATLNGWGHRCDPLALQDAADDLAGAQEDMIIDVALDLSATVPDAPASENTPYPTSA